MILVLFSKYDMLFDEGVKFAALLFILIQSFAGWGQSKWKKNSLSLSGYRKGIQKGVEIKIYSWCKFDINL